MNKKYSLNLYQNAIDSLNVGMEMYEKAIEDESKFKYSVILISNFMELLLKSMVEKQNPLLCYVEPYSNKICYEKTITWRQAIQILMNSGKIISKKLIDNIIKLTDLRNKIIHFKFEYVAVEIIPIILSVIDGLRQLYKDTSDKDFIEDVQKNTKVMIENIKGEYLRKLHQAQINAKYEADETGMDVNDCYLCGNTNTAVERYNKEIYCYLCNDIDYEANCSRCTETFRVSEMNFFGKNEYGDPMYFCNYCISLFDED